MSDGGMEFRRRGSSRLRFTAGFPVGPLAGSEAGIFTRGFEMVQLNSVTPVVSRVVIIIRVLGKNG